MDDKKPINHIMALKLAMAKKKSATHPDTPGPDNNKNIGHGPVRANKPQKKVTGRGR